MILQTFFGSVKSSFPNTLRIVFVYHKDLQTEEV